MAGKGGSLPQGKLRPSQIGSPLSSSLAFVESMRGGTECAALTIVRQEEEVPPRRVGCM